MPSTEGNKLIVLGAQCCSSYNISKYYPSIKNESNTGHRLEFYWGDLFYNRDGSVGEELTPANVNVTATQSVVLESWCIPAARL